MFLIADDSASKRAWLIELFERVDTDWSLVVASNTDEAKQMIDNHEIQAAWIDYEMPSERGPAVMSHLRQRNPHALIACVSSGSSQHYRDSARQAGANTYVCTSHESDGVDLELTNLLVEWKIKLANR